MRHRGTFIGLWAIAIVAASFFVAGAGGSPVTDAHGIVLDASGSEGRR